jgi:fibronectin type 3 domain-containing protein
MTAGYLIGSHVYDFYVTTAVGGGVSGPSNVVRITAIGGPPPSAPTLSATAGNARVTLSWTDTGDYFWIYKRCVSCGETNFTRSVYPTNVTTFVDTYVPNGFTYEYRVSATNANGESTLSNAVRVRPLPPLPGAPTGLTATPGDGKVTLRWTAPSGSGLLYVVYQRDVTAGQASFSKLPLPVSGTTMTAGYLANGHRYEFYVRAANVAGEGPKSATVAATPMPPKPTAPTNLSVTYPGLYSARLTWSASTPSNVFYWIYMRDVSLGQGFRRMYYPVVGTSIVIEPLQRGHKYEFYVTADNLAGESGHSNHVFVSLGPTDGTSACTSP